MYGDTDIVNVVKRRGWWGNICRTPDKRITKNMIIEAEGRILIRIKNWKEETINRKKWEKNKYAWETYN